MEKTYEKIYESLYSDIDYRREVLMTSIINYFGDIATCHSDHENVGVKYLQENNLGWVLYKWDVTILRHPIYGEKLYISTKASGLKKFYAQRTFEIKNEKGEILCKADSLWLLINTVRRRAIRIPQVITDAFRAEENIRDMEDVMSPWKEDFKEEFKVRYSDIDTNRHVNNAKYVDWAIEAIPFDVVSSKRFKRFKMLFKKEVLYGHKITSICQCLEEGHYLHKIINDDGVELNISETFWE